MSDTGESSPSQEEFAEEAEAVGTYGGPVKPYQHDPLALDGSINSDTSNEDLDFDGLSPAILRDRYERMIDAKGWCKCGRCNVDNLVSSLEYRCCAEVMEARGKLILDGTIEKISRITEHEDFEAMTNSTVLSSAGPLLKDRQGKIYRRRGNINEYLRAVAYRWLARWLFDYMGWDKSRPLSACIYNNIREIHCWFFNQRI